MSKNLKNLFLVFFLFLLFPFVFAGELRVTQEHPFLIDGEWISASELKIGDELTLANGSKVKITKLTDYETEESFKVYNLEAGEYHNFVVGEEGVVVHNSDSRSGFVLIPSRKDWVNLFHRILMKKSLRENKFMEEDFRARRLVDKDHFFKAMLEGKLPDGQAWEVLKEHPGYAYNQKNEIMEGIVNTVGYKKPLFSWDLWCEADDYLRSQLRSKKGLIDEKLILGIGKRIGFYNDYRKIDVYFKYNTQVYSPYAVTQMRNNRYLTRLPIEDEVFQGVLYPSEKNVPTLIRDLIRRYNTERHRIRARGDNAAEIINLAADFQRDFVSIHPFPNHNGRTSRLLMDYILQSGGLPPAHLSTTSELSLSISGWREAVDEGVQNALENIKHARPIYVFLSLL